MCHFAQVGPRQVNASRILLLRVPLRTKEDMGIRASGLMSEMWKRSMVKDIWAPITERVDRPSQHLNRRATSRLYHVVAQFLIELQMICSQLPLLIEIGRQNSIVARTPQMTARFAVEPGSRRCQYWKSGVMRTDCVN